MKTKSKMKMTSEEETLKNELNLSIKTNWGIEELKGM